MELVVLCGVQCSGKTTFYRERFADTHVRVSLDMLRTRHREAILVEACLRARQRFVVDNTNPRRSDRARYLGPAREAGFRAVAYWFDVPLREAIDRNHRRTGPDRVAMGSVVTTFRRIEPPAPEEGFDEVRRVQPGPAGSFVVEDLPPVRP